LSNQKIRVLHFSSRNEECGVAKYLGHYIKGMGNMQEIENEYFEVSPYKTPGMSPSDLDKMSDMLQEKLKNYDILHVQHEFALYAHDSFRRIVDAGKRAGKKVVITVHISPSMHGASKAARLRGLGPRSIVSFLRKARHHRQFIELYIEPFRKADVVIVHNDAARESLKSFGIPEERIKKMIHPVQVYDKPAASTLISNKLNKQKDDIIYCTIGFIHRYKGLIDAVKALKFLPDNYKLAILGGMKADSDDVEFYNDLCDLIDNLGVRERVFITGYVQGDDNLNALIQECNVCVYPYDRVYYSNVSSGTLNLGFSNNMPVIAYPTETFKEVARASKGAVALSETFAYYELARTLQSINLNKQHRLSHTYALDAAWPKASKELIGMYVELARA
jgi:glycosyltransferase involved in cell wall biosynthesis